MQIKRTTEKITKTAKSYQKNHKVNLYENVLCQPIIQIHAANDQNTTKKNEGPKIVEDSKQCAKCSQVHSQRLK